MAQPSQNVEDLARYAVGPGRKSFRIRACKRESLDAAIQAELADGAGHGFHALSEEEREYVLGWMRLNEDEYLDEKGHPDDARLIAAIQAELHGDEHGDTTEEVMTG
jgi:hypothetical protein